MKQLIGPGKVYIFFWGWVHSPFQGKLTTEKLTPPSFFGNIFFFHWKIFTYWLRKKIIFFFVKLKFECLFLKKHLVFTSYTNSKKLFNAISLFVWPLEHLKRWFQKVCSSVTFVLLLSLIMVLIFLKSSNFKKYNFI